MSKKYIPQEKKSISKKEIRKAKNFKEILSRVKDELKGKLVVV